MDGPMDTGPSIDSTATRGALHVERGGATPVFSVTPIKIPTFAEATSGHGTSSDPPVKGR